MIFDLNGRHKQIEIMMNHLTFLGKSRTTSVITNKGVCYTASLSDKIDCFFGASTLSMEVPIIQERNE